MSVRVVCDRCHSIQSGTIIHLTASVRPEKIERGLDGSVISPNQQDIDLCVKCFNHLLGPFFKYE